MPVHEKSNRWKPGPLIQSHKLRLRQKELEDALRSNRGNEIQSDLAPRNRIRPEGSLGGARFVCRIIVETITEAAVAVSPDGTILLSNARFGDLVGERPESIAGRRFQDYVSPNHGEEADKLHVLTHGVSAYRLLNIAGANRKTIPVQVSAGILEYPEGAAVYLVISHHAALQDSMRHLHCLEDPGAGSFQECAQLAAILKPMPAGVIVAEAPTGRILVQNEQVARIWQEQNIAASSLKEYGGYEGFHPDGRRYDLEEWPLVRSIQQGEHVLQEEIRILKKDGSCGWISVNSAPIKDADGKIAFAVAAFIDISRMKKTEEELCRLRSEMEQRIAERKVEARNQADQLRALAGQLNRTELNERKRLAKVLHDHVQQLIIAARLQLERIRQNPDAASEQMQKAVVSINAVLNEAIEASRSLASDLFPPVLHQIGLIAALKWLAERMQAKRSFEIDLDLNADAEPTSEQTRYMLYECARELLMNAIKHAEVPKAYVQLSRAAMGEIRLVVRDEGKGFDSDSIFERKPGDTTFGLFGIRERLEFCGGQMEIRTAHGAGAMISIVVADGETGIPPVSPQGV